MKATTLDLRRRMRQVLQALARNEQVTLTHRGKVVGTIHPASERNGAKRKDIRSTPLFGMWADREDMKDPVEWLRKQRGKRRERLRTLWTAPLPKSKRG